MPFTSYEKIYERFLRKIKDFDIAEFLSSEDEEIQSFVEDMLWGFLEASISKFTKCIQDLSNRDDEQKGFNLDLSDIEQEILALMMIDEWIMPQLNSTENTLQFIGGTNTKFYAQANQLDKLQSLEEKSRIKARKLIRDYTYQVYKSKLRKN